VAFEPTLLSLPATTAGFSCKWPVYVDGLVRRWVISINELLLTVTDWRLVVTGCRLLLVIVRLRRETGMRRTDRCWIECVCCHFQRTCHSWTMFMYWMWCLTVLFVLTLIAHEWVLAPPAA